MTLTPEGCSKMRSHGRPCEFCAYGTDWMPVAPILDLLLDKLRALTRLQQGRRSIILDSVARLIACGTVYRSDTGRFLGDGPHRWKSNRTRYTVIVVSRAIWSLGLRQLRPLFL